MASIAPMVKAFSTSSSWLMQIWSIHRPSAALRSCSTAWKMTALVGSEKCSTSFVHPNGRSPTGVTTLRGVVLGVPFQQ